MNRTSADIIENSLQRSVAQQSAVYASLPGLTIRTVTVTVLDEQSGNILRKLCTAQYVFAVAETCLIPLTFT